MGTYVIAKIANYITVGEVSKSPRHDIAETVIFLYINRQASENSVATIQNIIKSGKSNIHAIMSKAPQKTHVEQYLHGSKTSEMSR